VAQGLGHEITRLTSGYHSFLLFLRRFTLIPTNRPNRFMLSKRILPLLLFLLLAVPGAWARKPTKPAAKSTPQKTQPKPKSESAPKSGKSSGSDENPIAAWSGALDRAEDRQGEKWTVYVKDMQTGETILAHGKDRRLIPASNRKVMIFAMALEKLGPDFKFKTQLGLTHILSRDQNSITANVVLRSNGDPTMDSRYLNQKNPAAVIRGWIKDLARSGVKRVQGEFIIDASAFGSEQDMRPAAWGSDHLNQSYAPLPSAIAIGQNLLEVAVEPGRLGQEGQIRIYPSSEGLDIDNETETTSSSGCSIGVCCSDDGRSLRVTGRIGRRSGPEVDHVPVGRPLAFIKGIVEDELRDSGITITGKVRLVTDSNEAERYEIGQVIGEHDSPELSQLLHVMLRDSDNFLAEQIWRATAHRVFGRGDPTMARKLEQQWYSDDELSWIEPGFDGSGLSRRNSFSASEMVSILEVLYKSPYRDYLLDCLPCAARTGTLRHRDMGAANGRVSAKTGTLSGASALSGFLRDREGKERWAFAMIGNASGDTNGRLVGRVDQLMRILANMMDSGYKPSRTADSQPEKPAPGAETAELVKGGA